MRHRTARAVLLAGLLTAALVPLGAPAGLSTMRNHSATGLQDSAPLEPSESAPTDTPTETTGPVNPTFAPTPLCTPTTPLVDPLATPEALCLAQTLDTWQRDGVYGVGQQLNISTSDYLAPLRQLEPQHVALVGFDLEELEQAETFDFLEQPVASLLDLAAQGTVLTASWHTKSPQSGFDSRDLRWKDLAALLDPTTAQAKRFWADYDVKLDLLRRLQTGEDGQHPPAAVLFRPLHEANGDWFWWSSPDAATYKALWAKMQDYAASAGVHNIVWGWSANARNNDTIIDPMTLVPDRVDLVGIDTYDPVSDGGAEELDLGGLAELAASHPRIAITEVGPHGSKDGAWDPAVITRAVQAVGLRPAYVLLWFDDGNGDDGYTGVKQIGSLAKGKTWLQGCPEALCSLS